MATCCTKIINKMAKTVGKKNEIDDVMKLSLISQRIFGHQVLDPDWSWSKFYKHKIMSALLIVYVFFGTLEIVNSTEDPELIAEAGYTLTLLAACPIKLILFINNRFMFRKLYITAKTKLYTAVKGDPDVNIKEILKIGNKVVYVLLGMVVVPICIYEVTTLWNYVNGRRSLLSQSTATLMPMSFPYYELAWFLHSVFMMLMSTIVIVIDMWFAFLMYSLCAASETLVKILRVEPKGDNECSVSYSKRLNLNLGRFYRDHVGHVDYLTTLNSMYKWLALVPLFSAAMCICVVLLVLSEEINWRFAPHIVPLLAEIFVYSYFGEKIKTKGNEMKIALLNFDWINMEQKDKINYYIIATYIQRNFGIKVANGKDLSMVTMTTVLKATYQVYTVLQSVDT